MADTTPTTIQMGFPVWIQSQIELLNANLKTVYLQSFSNWLISWSDGKVTDKSSAPVPPPAFVLGWYDDPTTGPGKVGTGQIIQWPYAAVGSTPVCPQPAIPDVPPAQVSHQILTNPTAMNVPPGDTLPIGSVITAPDGSKWAKTSSPTPWGIAVYYLKQ